MAIKHIQLGPCAFKEVYAVADDTFALHPDAMGSGEMFTITHVPTGYAVVPSATWTQALDVLALLAESELDFQFTDPQQARNMRADMYALLVKAGVTPWFQIA